VGTYIVFEVFCYVDHSCFVLYVQVLYCYRLVLARDVGLDLNHVVPHRRTCFSPVVSNFQFEVFTITSNTVL